MEWMKTCEHCGLDLDGGDVFDVMYEASNNKDYSEVYRVASMYGWTPYNRLHFSKAIVVQQYRRPDKAMCPGCKGYLHVT